MAHLEGRRCGQIRPTDRHGRRSFPLASEPAHATVQAWVPWKGTHSSQAMIAALSSFPALLAQTAPPVEADLDGPNLFLFGLMVVALVALCVLAVVGALLGLAVAAAGGAAVVSGAAASSALTAAVRKSPAVGVTLFVLQLSAAAGAALGVVAASVVTRLLGHGWFTWPGAGIGLVAGALTAAGLSWLSLVLWRRLWHRGLEAWKAWRAARSPRPDKKPAGALPSRGLFHAGN